MVVGLDRATLIDRLTNHVEDTTKGLTANGNTNGRLGVGDRLTTHEAISTVHGNGPHGAITKVLRHLEDQTLCAALHFEGRLDGREVTLREVHINDGPDDLGHLAVTLQLGEVNFLTKLFESYGLGVDVLVVLHLLEVFGGHGAGLPPLLELRALGPFLLVGFESTSLFLGELLTDG